MSESEGHEEAELEDVEKRRLEDESLIRQLRREAYEVRDCFTRHSFQGMAATIALLMLLLKFQTEHVELGLAAILPVALLFAIMNMGLHKYATSNRLLGYELYLQKARHYGVQENFHPAMRDAGWEEIMRAWRIIFPSVFDQLYARPWSGRRLLRMAYGFCPVRPSDKLPAWSVPRQLLLESGSAYRSGAYLRTLIYSFFILIAVAFSDVAISLIAAAPVLKLHLPYPVLAIPIISIVLAISAAIIIGRLSHVVSRIKLLEDEIQSIHTCSIIWEVTVLSHFLALDSVGLVDPARKSAGRLLGYTAELGVQASKIMQRVGDLHAWMDEQRPKLFEIMDRKPA